ncbi:hypothetical protein Tco_0814848 [Tanacetum coccineum]
MRELREDTFSRNKNDDAHEHVERVLDIVSLFNIPEVSHDAIILLLFPITLTGAAKRWTAKQLEEIHKFKQKGDETLYQAWERYNELLYKCPTHDINSHQKVNIFYNGLGTMNHQLLDSQGLIPGMTPTQALTFEECKTICTEDGSPLYTPFYYSPDEIEYFSANSGFSYNEKQETDNLGMAEVLTALEATLKIKKEPKEEKQSVNYYVDPYEPPIPFPRRLEHHAEEALVHKTMESLKKIKINHPLLKEIRQTDNYAKHMKDFVENKPRTEEDEEIRMNPRYPALLQNHLPPKEQDP